MSSNAIQRLGFSVLDTCDKDSCKPIANIVFVHGLRGHPRHTWEQQRSPQEDQEQRSKSSSRLFKWRSHKRSASSTRSEDGPVQLDAETLYWPQDLLPQSIPNARILTYGYDADVIGGLFKGASKNNVTQHGRDLMLKLEREVDGEPIIFVAHSLGGILVKEGLHWSKSHISPRYQRLHQCTKYVIFLGVPHRGSEMASIGETLARLANAALQDSNRHLVSSLEVENELLDRINTEFVKMVQLEDFGVYSFQESAGLSGLKGFSGKVVSDYSSKLDHPLEIVETIRGNHMEMARFSDVNDEGYRTLSKVIARCITDSQRREKDDELTAGTGASASTRQKRLFRIPHISNSHFIGREKELLWLQTHLADRSSEVEQQRVAVWGPGGAGKTQLVSTFAFKNQSKYSAVFWVTASSETTLRKTYADIAKYLDLALPAGGDLQTAIESVRDWFTDHEKGDWLLVIDNADRMNEVDIQAFIPPINKGSVIITSRNREAAELGTPIELGEMKAEDAAALLFHKAAIHHPTAEDALIGAEITKSLGYLALAVEHAGAYIHSVGGTLQEYLQQFQNNRRDALEKKPAFSMHKESVFETFNMSFNAIVERDMAAARLLCFMGFLDADGVREELMLSPDERNALFRAQVVKDEKLFLDAIKVLLSFSLIRVKIDTGKKSISLHPLVHYLSRARLNLPNQWRWKLRVVSWLVQASAAVQADMVYFRHVREQMQQMEEIKTFPADDQRRKTIFCFLALLQNHYMFAWQNQGAMDELHRYSETVRKVLEEDVEDQEGLSVVAMVILVEVQAIAGPYVSSEFTYEQTIQRYLLKQMTPLAKQAWEKAGHSQKKNDTSDGKAQMSLPSKVDALQDVPLSLQRLTRALTQTFDSETLVMDNSNEDGVEVGAAPGSSAIISDIGKSSTSPDPDDGGAKRHSSCTTKGDLLPLNQQSGLETAPRPTSPTVSEQMIEKENDVDIDLPPREKSPLAGLAFAPKHLRDVFLSVTPPIRVQCFLNLLSFLIKVYYTHHRDAEANLLTTYSTLPFDSPSSQTPDSTTPSQVTQLLIEASRLAATADLDGTLAVFRKIISLADNTSTEVRFVTLDYTIILNKLGRPTETARILNEIFYSTRITAVREQQQPIDPIELDRDLARELQSGYVWLKKTLATSQRLRGQVEQCLKTLLTTLETAQAVFGTSSLSYLHAAFLLHRFYSCGYYVQGLSTIEEASREAARYSDMFATALESLYCSGKKSGGGGKPTCSVEGLQMGITLRAQGALEETVAVLEVFAALSGKIMGADDGLSRRARQEAALARGEWENAKMERKEDILRFGTMVFPRRVEDLTPLVVHVREDVGMVSKPHHI